MLILAILVASVKEIQAQFALPVGISTTIFNATATVTSGTTWAVPGARAYILSYVVDYTGAPGSITLCIQGSNNNVAWFDLSCTSSTTDTGGNIGPTAVKFVRVNISAVAAGTPTVVTMVVQGFNNPAVYSGGTLTTPLIVPAGTHIAPSLAFNGPGGNTTGFHLLSGTDYLVAQSLGQDVFLVDVTPQLLLASATGLTWSSSSSGSQIVGAADTRFRRTAANTVTLDNGAGGDATLVILGGLTTTSNTTAFQFVGIGGGSVLNLGTPGISKFLNNPGTRVLTFQNADIPTCTSNCGTSPSSSGVGSSFTITMGATGVPASGFVITFATAWAAAPQCVGSMAKAGMVVGKLPLTLVTTTTTLTVVTNGTAPATTDVYNFICSLGQ